MSEPDFFYQMFLKAEDSPEVTTVVAYSAPAHGPLQAVLWHVARQQWIYAPAIAAGLLFDDLEADMSMKVDRVTAEQIAHDQLRTELPSPATLRSMSAEGDRMGWAYGPPVEQG
jgi:hypothetical protein